MTTAKNNLIAKWEVVDNKLSCRWVVEQKENQESHILLFPVTSQAA